MRKLVEVEGGEALGRERQGPPPAEVSAGAGHSLLGGLIKSGIWSDGLESTGLDGVRFRRKRKELSRELSRRPQEPTP